MNVVDLGLLIIVILFSLLGLKSGLIKSTVRLFSFLISAIIAYQLKGIVAGFLIDVMPFVNFGGIFEGVTSMNVIFYHGVSFLVIFIILYSILSIVIILAGFLDKLVNLTIILAGPNKLFGAIVGFIHGTMVSFIIIFILAQIPYTQAYIIDSSYGYQLLNRTPIIRTVLADGTVISSEIADLIMNSDISTQEGLTQVQTSVMNLYVRYGLITSEKAQELVDDEKVYLPGVQFTS